MSLPNFEDVNVRLDTRFPNKHFYKIYGSIQWHKPLYINVSKYTILYGCLQLDDFGGVFGGDFY